MPPKSKKGPKKGLKIIASNRLYLYSKLATMYYLPSEQSKLGSSLKYLKDISLSSSNYYRIPLKDFKVNYFEKEQARLNTGVANVLYLLNKLLSEKGHKIIWNDYRILPDVEWTTNVCKLLDPDDKCSVFTSFYDLYKDKYTLSEGFGENSQFLRGFNNEPEYSTFNINQKFTLLG